MPEKPQQQTLSVRISEALRARLERVRKLASKAGENVSMSDIAKQLLESARDDRLEVVDLLADPTDALLEIRRKGEAQHPLSHAEWTLLAHFVQEGLEAYSVRTPNAISPDSWLAVIDAFQAVYALRGDRSSPNDAFYIENLPVECRPKRGSDNVTPDAVRRTIAETRKRVVAADGSTVPPVFVGRNLYRILEDGSFGHESIDRALRSFWSSLWRLAARGHYALTERPVREPVTKQDGLYQTPLPPLEEGSFTLSFARGEGAELSVLLSFPSVRGPLYPMTSYPKIAEFRAMLTALDPPSHTRPWTGEYFFGYVQPSKSRQPAEVWFRAHENGITFGVSADEWTAMRTLFRRAWELPDIQLAWDRLTLDYGAL
jgi:hypothetical protein